MSILKPKIASLSQGPGVYFFRDKAGKILYIGKATNLRSRVQSYFRGGEAGRLIGAFIGEIANVGVQKTDSVLEALILEANLIKKYLPEYNVMGKDDKSFAYFAVTKDEFPRVIILRKTDLADAQVKKIYGPYASKRQMELALKIIRRIFPFHSLKQKTEKGCLDFQLGRCPGPYAGAISKTDYLKNIRGIRMILEGKKNTLLKQLEKEMKAFAKQNYFEKAADIRNKVFALKHIQDVSLLGRDEGVETQSIASLRIEAYDISNISGQHAVGSMVVFKNNHPDKTQYRKFKIKTVVGSDDVGMMREVLLRRFKNDWAQPDLILLDGGKGHLNMAQKLLLDLGLIIPTVAVAKGPTRKKLGLYSGNYELSKKINNILSDQHLLSRIMGEAHRFAIAYHRKVRRKNLLG